MCVPGICREEAEPRDEGAGPLELGAEGPRPGVLGWGNVLEHIFLSLESSWMLHSGS